MQVVSREVLIHLIHYLLDDYSKNETIKTLMDNTVIHILVSMNPDGYQKAFEAAVDDRPTCFGDIGR
jgi:carboxypeptidase D